MYAVADPVATDENAPTKPRPMKTDAVRETVADTEIVMETEKNEPEKDPAAGENGMFNDMSRVAVVGTVLAVIAALFQHSWVAEHRDVAMIAVFVLGYAGIIFEELWVCARHATLSLSFPCRRRETDRRIRASVLYCPCL